MWFEPRCCRRANSSTSSAARAIGAATPRILIRHILPAALPALTVQATLGMGGAILSEAALSFLGLGVQPPTPSWGAMLNYGRAHVLDAPHLTVFPGLAIAVVVLGLNLLGDSLRDRFGRPRTWNQNRELESRETRAVSSRRRAPRALASASCAAATCPSRLAAVAR